MTVLETLKCLQKLVEEGYANLQIVGIGENDSFYLNIQTVDTNTEEEYCLDGALGDFDEGEQFIRCDLTQ